MTLEVELIQPTPTTIESEIVMPVLNQGGGSSDYNDLQNKPSINGVTLQSDKSLQSIGALPDNHNVSLYAHNDIREILKSASTIPVYDAATYKLTFETIGGVKVEIDLPIEQIGLTYDSRTKEMLFVNAEGVTQRIPLSDFIDIYIGSAGPDIQISIDTGNVIRASILNASITLQKLDLSIQEEIAKIREKAENDLSNVENSQFYSKGVQSGLGQIIPEIQPTTEVYVTSYNAATKTVTLSDKKPTNPVNIPLSITTSGTLIILKYIYTGSGQISALSRWKLVLYFESLETNKDYEFSATQIAFVGGKQYLIGGDLYVNRFAIQNPRVEIPLENNVLPTNLDRVAGDYMEIDLLITKSSGNADTINILSDGSIHDSKLVRNGGDIGSINVVDFNGVDVKTLSQRLRDLEQRITVLEQRITTL